MRKILITGGTVFVSRYLAEYYVAKGDDVYVINRNTRKQSKGVTLLEADRHRLGDLLRRISRVYFYKFKRSLSRKLNSTISRRWCIIGK